MPPLLMLQWFGRNGYILPAILIVILIRAHVPTLASWSTKIARHEGCEDKHGPINSLGFIEVPREVRERSCLISWNSYLLREES